MRLFLFIACVLAMPFSQAETPVNRHQATLETPAVLWPHAARATMSGIAYADKDLVAVGRLGIALTSADEGRAWTQAKVPVQSDLVAVSFAAPGNGWAVGHEGVVLASIDGGRNWVKKFDGVSIAEMSRAYYRKLADEHPQDKALATVLAQAEQLVKDGPDKPFLDVWFQDERRGFMVGAFGLILATEDGGASWQPWLDRLDNPNTLHLNAVRGEGENVFLAGEQGLLFKLDRAAKRFVQMKSPSQGSYFGVAVQGQRVLLYGLRGRAFLSTNSGETWQTLATGTETALTGGTFLGDGRVTLVGGDGTVLVGDSDAKSFTPYVCQMACHAVIASHSNSLVVVGSRGARVLSIK